MKLLGSLILTTLVLGETYLSLALKSLKIYSNLIGLQKKKRKRKGSLRKRKGSLSKQSKRSRSVRTL